VDLFFLLDHSDYMALSLVAPLLCGTGDDHEDGLVTCKQPCVNSC
jgi:hypothetical protein